MNVDEVIEKIKKAIRLASRTTSEGERDTAMRLARNLAEKNGIAFEDISADERSADRVVKEDDDLYHCVEGCEIGHSCYILHQHFGVILMLNRKRGWQCYKASYSWFGSRLNIEIAKHIHHILLRESRKAWEKCRKMGIHLDKASFMKGFFWQISRKLTEHPLRNDIDIDRSAAERAVEVYRESHKVKDQRQRQGKTNAESIIAGASAANSVNLARPCEGAARRNRELGQASVLALTA